MPRCGSEYVRFIIDRGTHGDWTMMIIGLCFAFMGYEYSPGLKGLEALVIFQCNFGINRVTNCE